MFKKTILFLMMTHFFMLVNIQISDAKDQMSLSIIEKRFEDTTLNNARRLILQRKADEAISILTKNQVPVCNDFDCTFLYAEAYLEKCLQLQETMNASGKKYKDLISIPFNEGRKIMTRYKNYNNKLAYGSYICAKSFLLNNRPERARKYIDYAIDISLSADPIFYAFKADVLAEEYCRNISASKGLNSPAVFKNDIDESSSQYQNVIKTYEQVAAPSKDGLMKSHLYYKMGVFEFTIARVSRQDDGTIEEPGIGHMHKAEKYLNLALSSTDDRTKSMSYYYLGTIQTYQGNKEKAQKAFSAALSFTADNALKEMIRKKMYDE